MAICIIIASEWKHKAVQLLVMTMAIDEEAFSACLSMFT